MRALDLYSLRHTFASFGRTAGESAFNVARMMGHSRSNLVDSVYAHSLQSGMASVADSVTQKALGVKAQLRVIEGGNSRDVSVRRTHCWDICEHGRSGLTRWYPYKKLVGREGFEPSTLGLRVPCSTS